MLIAIGLFAWSFIQSSREGSRVTASESPRTGGGLTVTGYETLARVYPPAYRDLDTASNRSAELRTAIDRYTQRDFSSAIPAFITVVNKQPASAEARLYLGICYLAAEKGAAGVAELRKVVEAGDTPYLEQARFYLAKGLLSTGDIAGARQQLNDAVAMHGDLEQQAETLLARLK